MVNGAASYSKDCIFEGKESTFTICKRGSGSNQWQIKMSTKEAYSSSSKVDVKHPLYGNIVPPSEYPIYTGKKGPKGHPTVRIEFLVDQTHTHTHFVCLNV